MTSWRDTSMLWLLLGITGIAAGQPSAIRAVQIGAHRLAVDVADTPDTQQQGLSKRDSLAPDSGMLFVYPSPKLLRFWMKETKIPLSVAFLDARGRVLNIEDMKPLDEKVVHTSKGDAQYAIEANRGWFEQHGLKVGDAVSFVSTVVEVDAVVVNGHKLTVETVQTPDKIERGLMFRDKLPDDHGMLFIFGKPQILGFWMKNTLIPLSIAFLDRDRRILNLDEMKQLDDKTRHRSKGPALYAIEANRGWFTKNGARPGEVVTFLQRSRELVVRPGEQPR